MKDFMVEVVSCKDASFWYADKIGQRFPVRRIGDKETYVSTFDSYNTGNYVQNEDAKIFEVGEE